MAQVIEDKVVIVTGAGRGVGAEIAKLAAKEGAKVVVNDLGGNERGEGGDLGPAQQVVEEIKAAGGEAVANGNDVSSWDGAHELFAQAMKTYGDVDAIVNNAGILLRGTLPEADAQHLEDMWKINVEGLYLGCRVAVKNMRPKVADHPGITSPSIDSGGFRAPTELWLEFDPS